jgi:hypothetical protein
MTNSDIRGLINGSMRFAALKPFGNPEVSDQWDVFQIPNIEIRGKYTWP